MSAFGSGYNIQFQIMAGFGVTQIVTVEILYRNAPIRVVEDVKPKEMDQNSSKEKSLE